MMLSKLKSKVCSFLFSKKKSSMKRMIELGLIQIGENTDISNLKIEIRNPIENKTFVKIGKNCLLTCTIVLETKEAMVEIGDSTFIGSGLIVCANEVKIGSDVMFSWGFTVIDTDAHSLKWEERKNDLADWKKGIDENTFGKYKNWKNVKSKKIEIKDKAWIGFNSIILKDVTMGEGSIVAAGSTVTKSVPPFSIVAGNPAKIIKYLK